MGRKKSGKKTKRKRGRPIKYHDILHRYWREQKRKQRLKKKRK